MSQRSYFLPILFPDSHNCFGEVFTYMNFFSLLADGFIQKMLLTFVVTEFCKQSSAFTCFFRSNWTGSFNLNLVYTQLFMPCILSNPCVVLRLLLVFCYSIYTKFASLRSILLVSNFFFQFIAFFSYTFNLCHVFNFLLLY